MAAARWRAAIAEQAMRLSYNSPWGFANEPAARLARKLAELAPGDLNTVMFTTGGSTAVDTALRFTHFYNNRLGRPDKKIVISRERSYHGSTYLSASASGKERFASWFDRESRLVHFLPDVSPNLRPEGAEPRRLGGAQGAGPRGRHPPHRRRAGRRVHRRADPGLGRGGDPGSRATTSAAWRSAAATTCSTSPTRWSPPSAGSATGSRPRTCSAIEPDIITCAKGLTSGYLPLGACLISDRLMAEVTGEDHEQILFSNGYTYSGHPVCCAAALENIRIIEDEGLLEHVRAIAPHFNERLHALRRHPIVGDTRGIGLVGCVEGRPHGPGDRFARDLEFGSRVDQVCEELGLIVRPLVNMCVAIR